jgi:hypothetical protein
MVACRRSHRNKVSGVPDMAFGVNDLCMSDTWHFDIQLDHRRSKMMVDPPRQILGVIDPLLCMIYHADHGPRTGSGSIACMHNRQKGRTTRLRCKLIFGKRDGVDIGIPKCRSMITNVDPKAPSPNPRWDDRRCMALLIEHVQIGRHFPFHLSASPRQLQDTGSSICKSVCRSGLRTSRALGRSGSIPRPASPFACNSLQYKP